MVLEDIVDTLDLLDLSSELAFSLRVLLDQLVTFLSDVLHLCVVLLDARPQSLDLILLDIHINSLSFVDLFEPA